MFTLRYNSNLARAASITMGIAVFASQAHAVIFTVGPEPACTHPTLDSALSALPAGGFHEVRIDVGTLSGQAAHITSRGVTVRGGYANCSAPTSTGSTNISGQGGVHDSVLTIRGSGNDVILERLSLIRGDEVFDGYGGGLDFKGQGFLTLRDVAVTQNYAGYGGGISFIAEGGPAELRLEAGSTIQHNTAQFSGGGIRVGGNAHMTMLGINSTIAANEARGVNPNTNFVTEGYGGGLQVVAPAVADIATPGIGNGAIVGNTARYGGGIAINVTDQNEDSRVNLFTTDRSRPIRIYGNRATNTGGGVYVGARQGGPNSAKGSLCALDTRIDNNFAAEGSAIYLDADNLLGFFLTAAGRAYLNESSYCPSQPGRTSCGPGDTCSTISGNRTENAIGQATAGATLLVQNYGELGVNRVNLSGNTGAYAIRAFGDSNVRVYSSLISSNTLTAYPFRREDSGGGTSILDSTIAGNVIGGDRVLSVNGSLSLKRSILWQPGKTILVHSGALTVEQSIASETGSLGGSPGAVVLSPRFVNPDRGDFRLRAASPAIDYVTYNGSNSLDLDGVSRDYRLAIVPRSPGLVSDIGAYERNGLLPLALNADFNADADLWVGLTSGTSNWDGTQNASGAANSGSIKVTQDGNGAGTRVYGLSQCIHLPGPGIYELNGWGRSGFGAFRDSVFLNWEYRAFGNEQCDAGAPTASGDHFLSSASSWQHPTNPKVISVPAAQWTTTSSIKITMVVLENGVSAPAATLGWFDGITLTPQGNDTIFKDGFDDTPTL